jgi:hypothetical protein
MNTKERSESTVNTLVCLFQAEVEKVIPLGYVCAGYEAQQADAIALVRQYTEDLRNGFDSHMALQIARLELDTIERAITMQSHIAQQYARNCQTRS